MRGPSLDAYHAALAEAGMHSASQRTLPMYDSSKTKGDTRSLWYSQLSADDEAALAGDGPLDRERLQVDVAIICAGMAGLSVAYHLCQAGRSVAIVDKGLIGSGETNTPIIDRFAMHTKLAAYRSYAIALRLDRPVPAALLWDTGDPYHYVRAADGGEVLIVGGEDHKVGQAREPERAWAELEVWARTHFPYARSERSRWSGQIMEPFDGMAFIGRNPGISQHVFIASGDSGNGITHGAIAGMLLSAMITERDSVHPWSRLYDPPRKPLNRAVRDYVPRERQRRNPLRAMDRADAEPRRAGTGRRRGHPSRPVARRPVRRARGRHARVFGALPASRLRGPVESRGAVLGLPVSRLALRQQSGAMTWTKTI